jgi:YggT family protein
MRPDFILGSMLYQIVSLLLEVAAGLLTGLCVLRLYMQHQRIPMSARSGNPMGPLIFASTDWVVLPLRRVLPAVGRWDTASLVAAWLAQTALYALLWLMNGAQAGVLSVAVMAVFGVLRTVISGLSGLVIVYAVLSWVQTSSHLSDLLERLVAPLLAVIRSAVPRVGGIDLSPLILLLILQVMTILLGGLQARVLAVV